MLGTETLEPLSIGNHMETNVHGIQVKTADPDTEKNVQGNDVKVADKDGHLEAQQLEAKQIEAKQVEVRQIEAVQQQTDAGRIEATRLEQEAEEAKKKGPQLIEESQFGLIDDIFNSAGKFSIGAAMRGVKQGVDAVSELVNPQVAELASAGIIAKATDALAQNAPEPAQALAAALPVEPKVETAVAARVKPEVVIVLPSDVVKVLAEMKDNKSLDFSYQKADRGQVLGTGAQHGISAKVDMGQQQSAAL